MFKSYQESIVIIEFYSLISLTNEFIELKNFNKNSINAMRFPQFKLYSFEIFRIRLCVFFSHRCFESHYVIHHQDEKEFQGDEK